MTPSDPVAYHNVMTCLLHYARHSDCGDYVSLSEAFGQDGVMEVGEDTILTGRSEIAETLPGSGKRGMGTNPEISSAITSRRHTSVSTMTGPQRAKSMCSSSLNAAQITPRGT